MYVNMSVKAKTNIKIVQQLFPTCESPAVVQLQLPASFDHLWFSGHAGSSNLPTSGKPQVVDQCCA